MPNETKEIAPALTPEEWRPRLVLGTFNAPQISDERSGMPKLWIEDGRIAVDSSSGEYAPAYLPPEKVMALANAALPDDDPRKITREDVQHCEAMAREWEAIHDDPDSGEHYDSLTAYEAYTSYRQLAAKLAALLPPE